MPRAHVDKAGPRIGVVALEAEHGLLAFFFDRVAVWVVQARSGDARVLRGEADDVSVQVL
jgi:hypothetical protein